MDYGVYRRLAQVLDALPNGFPLTMSGVELQLLAKIFALEEATWASVMRPTWEPAQAIAARAGRDPNTAYQTLKAMARKGLIYAGRHERHPAFARAADVDDLPGTLAEGIGSQLTVQIQ
jgi:hypothetical protein